MFRFAMGWNCSAHVSFRNGRELIRPCFVLLVLVGTFVPLFNVVLVARLGFFIFSPVGARQDFCFFVECRVGGLTRFFSS